MLKVEGIRKKEKKNKNKKVSETEAMSTLIFSACPLLWQPFLAIGYPLVLK